MARWSPARRWRELRLGVFTELGNLASGAKGDMRVVEAISIRVPIQK